MTGVSDGWEGLLDRAPRSVTVGGVAVGRGSRVRLLPRAGGDVFDLALAGQVAVVDRVEQDLEGAVHLAVTVVDDPGRDLGEERQPGHRFFFAPEEVEPLAGEAAAPAPATRVLLAGVGNVFMADDGFGPALARRLAQRELPRGVEVKDFGIRGMDLVYAMNGDHDVVVFLDAVPRGGAPGTLYVIEPEIDPSAVAIDTHGMDPVKVLGLAGQLGPVPERVLVVGCEPEVRMAGDEEEVVGELSATVERAVEEAVGLVESLVAELVESEAGEGEEGRT